MHQHAFLLSLAGSTKQLARQLPNFEHFNLFVRFVVTHAVRNMLARERLRCDYKAANPIVNLISNLTSISFPMQLVLTCHISYDTTEQAGSFG